MLGWCTASSETEFLHIRSSLLLFHISHLQNFNGLVFAFIFNLYLKEDPDFSVAFITQLSSTVKSPVQVFVLGYHVCGTAIATLRHSFAVQSYYSLRASVSYLSKL